MPFSALEKGRSSMIIRILSYASFYTQTKWTNTFRLKIKSNKFVEFSKRHQLRHENIVLILFHIGIASLWPSSFSLLYAVVTLVNIYFSFLFFTYCFCVLDRWAHRTVAEDRLFGGIRCSVNLELESFPIKFRVY